MKYFSSQDTQCAKDGDSISRFKTIKPNHTDRIFTNSNYLL